MTKRDQTETGNMYAMKALKDKRATLAGEIVSLKRQLDWATKQLVHVDACLTILDPAIRITGIGVKRPRKRVKLFKQGELGRNITDALRRAGKPMGTQELVTALLEASGYGKSARPGLAPRIRGNLCYQVKLGRVVSAGTGRAITWALKSP